MENDTFLCALQSNANRKLDLNTGKQMHPRYNDDSEFGLAKYISECF